MSVEKLNSVLVLGAHPDDDIIGCGATLAGHIQAGDDVRIVYVTSGESGNWEYTPDVLGPMREDEARTSARILGLGASALTFLRYPDKSVSEMRSKAIHDVFTIMQEMRPTRVYLPHESDGHPDHEAAFTIGTEASAMARGTRDFYGYEIWAPIPAPDILAGVSTAELELKMRAMRAHATQMLKMDYVDMILKRAATRGADSGTHQYAEAFRVYEGV